MKKVSSKTSQSGFSVTGTIILILLVSFFGNLIVKLGPIYTDHWYIKNVAQELSVSIGSTGVSSFEIADRMSKNLQVNNVTFDLKKGFKVDGSSNPRKIILDYTKQEHIMFNIEVLVSFHEEYVLNP